MVVGGGRTGPLDLVVIGRRWAGMSGQISMIPPPPPPPPKTSPPSSHLHLFLLLLLPRFTFIRELPYSADFFCSFCFVFVFVLHTKLQCEK